MSFLLSSTPSEYHFHDGRRDGIYLPDGLAAKLFSVCDAITELEFQQNSRIHTDLEDLLSNILTPSASPVDWFRAEEDIRLFAKEHCLVQCLENSSQVSFGEACDLEKYPEDLYDDILEAAFGSVSGRPALECEGHSSCSQLNHLLFNFGQAGGPTISNPEIAYSSPSTDSCQTPRVYYDRPHTPQIIEVNRFSKNRQYDFWEIPNLMKKPSLFPPTPRNIKNWIFWQRVHRGRF